ncbi:uncharacterized protein [Littorina saxatilis]|uniref:uncharacterized protein n=1 Tax=Littorina saxatilis TaxID=31220 RepID=UPI0038B62AD1
MENKTGIFLVLIFVTAVSGLDGFLRCNDKWISGFDVTLRCEVSKASIDMKCDTQQNTTLFKKDDVNQCTVLDNDYANCLPEGSQSEQTSSCWCEQNDTYFIFMHKFKADRFKSKGSWTCQKICFNSNGFTNPLIMSEDSSCDSSVEVSACETKPCNPIRSCKLDRERNTRRCMCPVGYTGEDCQLNPVLIALICVSTLLGVIMAAVGAGVYCARKQRSGGQQNAPPADAPPANAPLANAPQVNDPRNNTPPANAPQVAGSAGPSTGHTVQTTPYEEPDESSVAGSEASEGTEYNASEVSQV